MTYKNILSGRFVERPNRFIAYIEIDGKLEVCHVKNTGRCRELLVPDARVLVQKADNPNRKTKYDLIAVYKGERLINMDSQIPNPVFAEWAQKSGFFGKEITLRAETFFGKSRFDFYWESGERKGFVEVKGVTLEQDGVVLFPDAPTERGVKHLRELVAAKEAGFQADVFFIVQMEECDYFTPNRETHPAFAEALLEASQEGVGVYALNCRVTENTIEAKDFIEVRSGLDVSGE